MTTKPSDSRSAGQRRTRAAAISVLVAVSLVLIKVVAGSMANSLSLLASAVDSLTDIFASAVNFVAIRAASRPADREHVYGHGKAEGLAGLFQAVIIGLSGGRSIYPVSTVERFAAKLGSEHQQMWCHVLDAQPCLRSAAGAPAGDAPPAPPDTVPARVPGHTLLDDWIDIRLIARHTDAVTPLVVAPFAMLTLIVVARSRLFDNWALTWPIAFVAALCVVWLGLLTASLKLAAERMRASALDRMNADLRWLQGSSPEWKKLIEPMQRMLEWVKSERRGAFAAPFDQWFFKALLVPLGGAGGAQLVERLLMAR